MGISNKCLICADMTEFCSKFILTLFRRHVAFVTEVVNVGRFILAVEDISS